MRTFLLALACVAILTPLTANAHHGQDFLLVESPSVAHPGHVYLLANAGVALQHADEQAGFEPALLVGISPRLALELHAHTEKVAGEGWAYEATAPSVHWLLTDPARRDGFKAGLSAEYEFARESTADDRTELRLSAEKTMRSIKLAGNLIYSREQHGNGDFGLALGLRRSVGATVSLGMEAQGAFDHAEGRELLGGVYWEPNDSLALKFGLGGARGDDGHTTAMARIGVVLRLHH